MIEITEEEIKAELEKVNFKRICSVCKKEIPKNSDAARKYHPKCAEVIKKLQCRKHKQNITPETIKRSRIRSRVMNHQLKHPSCSYQQSGKCVKKYIEIEGIKIIVGGNKCPFIKNKHKCLNFKPKYPDIYKKIKDVISKDSE